MNNKFIIGFSIAICLELGAIVFLTIDLGLVGAGMGATIAGIGLCVLIGELKKV